MDQAIFQHFQNHIQTTMAVGENCAQSISMAADKLASTLINGNTIFSCGQGHSLPLSQLLVTYLTCGYQIERPRFPAIELEGLTAGNQQPGSYASSLSLHGHSDDALIVFGIGNNNQTLQQAIAAASEKGMLVILLSASNDDLLVKELSDNDIEIPTAESEQWTSISASFLILQCLCTLIDNIIFGGD